MTLYRYTALVIVLFTTACHMAMPEEEVIQMLTEEPEVAWIVDINPGYEISIEPPTYVTQQAWICYNHEHACLPRSSASKR